MRRFTYLRVILVVTLISLVSAWYMHPAQPVHAATPHLDDNRIPGEIALVSLLGLITVTTGIPAILLAGVFTGRVVDNPKYFNVFWADDWNSINDPGFTTDDINNFTSQLTGSNYFDGAAQYGVGSASFDGSHVASACGSPGSSENFLGIWGFISCEVQTPFTGVPFPDTNGNSIYNVWLPRDTDVGNHCQDFAAYHFFSAALTIDFPPPFFIPTPDVQQYAFTALPVTCAHGSFDELTSLSSHEMIEAATDPNFGAGWIDLSTFDFGALDHIAKAGEAADICEEGVGAAAESPVRLNNGIMVAPYWSNSANACFPATHTVSLDETGLPNTVAHTVSVTGAAINGDGNAHVLNLPFTSQVVDGATFSFSYPTPVNDPSPGIRYVTSDTGQDVTLTSDFSDTAAYSEEDFLTTNTNFGPPPPPSLTPSGWHARGSTVSLTTDAILSTPPDRWRFDHWSGGASGTTPDSSIVMNGPQTATANYVLQHLITFDESGIPLAVPWTVTVDGTSHAGPYNQWFDDGSSHSFSYQSPVPDLTPGTRYVLTATSEPTPLSATSTRTVTGSYKTQRLLTLQTNGLGSNLTTITLNAAALGTANDTTPLNSWLDDGTSLATLTADADVNGAGGIQYFFQSFTPAPPATLTAPFTTTAIYLTMEQLINNAIASGGITDPSAMGVGKALVQQFAGVQADMGANKYEPALGKLNAFINHVQAQCCTPSKEITPATSTTFQLDALLTYHIALCLGSSQLSAAQLANDNAYYKNLVTQLGGTVLPPC
jgi:hypothetical protein